MRIPPICDRLRRLPLKKLLLLLALFALVAVCFEYHGFSRGFHQGTRFTNTWWIDKKSTYYETKEVLRKRIDNGHNQI